jgi:flagellar motility protein MotE (MotC chaperone)
MLKLTLLGLFIFEPALPQGLVALLPASFSRPVLGGLSTARAAPDQNPAAPPAVEATLPDVGMTSKLPGVASHIEAPGAAPGIVSQDPAGKADPNRPLPSIGASRPRLDQQQPKTGANAGQTGATAPPTPLQPDIRDNLSKRQEDLSRKEQELRVLESELNSRLERMQMLENRLGEMMKEAEGTQDAKFRHLVDVLANMKARQAAAVLETLDQKVSVKLLAGMRGRQAGEILTYVKPEIAAKLTEALARMRLPLE